jgi:hypothetical protein
MLLCIFRTKAAHMPENIRLILSVLCIAAVVGILWWRLSPLLLFRKRAHRVTGTITNWMGGRLKGEAVFKPVIRFVTQDGREFTVATEDHCKGEPMYPIGTEVTVLYDPKNPENYRVDYPEQ